MLFTLLACDAGRPEPIEPADSGAESIPWQVVSKDMPGSFLSVWGAAADDVYVVGADAGGGPEAWHFDGLAWTPVDGLGSGDLWWVSGDASRVWTAGIGGRVFRVDRATAEVDAWVLDDTKTFFGVWGPGDGTAWAAGGDTELSGGAAVLWHFDGANWAPAELPSELASQYALFKVWGSAGDDVWTVGSEGVSGHWDGTRWTWIDTGAQTNLYTVNDGYAVGGSSAGTILRLSESGTAWVDESPDLAVQIFGVFGGAAPVAVGTRGSVWHRDDGEWVPDARALPTLHDLHSTWVDPDGGVWAAGGHFASTPMTQGTLVYSGTASIAGVPAVE
ncbi:MAG: hypothetical protein Q8P18_34750 [Pseudomonadota bacterium]|nr:hypothetical protein [Pseudomonadota bacterium]